MQVQMIQEWLDTKFRPWQEQAQQAQVLTQQRQQAFQGKRREVQRLVGLLLDGKSSQAVHVWNQLGLEPNLQAVELDDITERLALTLTDGRVVTLLLDELLANL